MSQLLYCRFCAEQKPLNDLIDLTSNSETRKVIIEKITTCNISCVDFSNKNLSEKICGLCLKTLDVFSEFLNKVKSSQLILSALSTYKSKCDTISMPYGNEPDFDCKSSSQKNENVESTLKLGLEVSVESANSEFDGNSNVITIQSPVNNVDDKNISWTSYPWSCVHCNISFESATAVREHSKKKHGVCNGFHCADCDAIQNEFESFIKHVIQHRKGLKHYCEHCNVKLKESIIRTHIHIHTCIYCGEVFSDEEHLNQHIKYQNKVRSAAENSKKKMLLKELFSYGVEIFDAKSLESWQDYPWICKFCDTKFPDQDVLRNHVKEVYGKCFGFKCADCPKNCDSFEGFVEHVRDHRPYLMYYCQYCNCTLEDTQTDIIHISKHLANHLCHSCGYIFKNDTDLQKHILMYNSPKLKRPSKRRETPTVTTVDDLTCNICQKVSKSMTILQAHKKLHTDRRRDYTCDRCGMAFFTNAALSTHKILHENPEPQVCLICKKEFLTLTRLRKHLKTHDSVKPFQCAECQRSFRLKEQLKTHLITHTDLLPHQCQYCDKAFKHKNVLKTHENQHTGLKPYSCLMCKMDFANWSNCNKHMKRKHGTTIAKNIMTPQGKVPLNPKTGKPRLLRDFETVKEWAEQILQPCKREKKKS